MGTRSAEEYPNWIRSMWFRKRSNSSDGDEQFGDRLRDARDILQRYERDRFPFVLFLGNFHVDFYFGEPPFPGDPSGVYRLRDRIKKELKRGVDLVAVPQPKGELPFLSSVKASPAPLISLNDASWEREADYLIRGATIIITEIHRLSWAVKRELEMIERHGKQDQTVVVVPDPQMGFDSVEALPPISTFPRVLTASELPLKNPLRSFLLMDLVERMYKITRLSGYERLSADLNGEWTKRLPVTFNGVGRGYDQLGRFYLNRGVLELAAVRFQRALAVHRMRGDLRGVAAQYVNLARVAFATSGNIAEVRLFLEQARTSMVSAGLTLDIRAIEREITFALIRKVMRHDNR